MGSGSSRLGSGQSRIRDNHCSKLLSSLICGSSSSRAAAVGMEDYSDENLVSSSEHCHPLSNAVQNHSEGSSSISCTGTLFTSPDTETRTSSVSNLAASEDGMRIVESNNRGKCLADNKELVFPHQVSSDSCHHESYRDRSSAAASTSFIEQESSDPVSVNDSANKNAVNCIDNSVHKGVSQNSLQPSCSCSQRLGGSQADGVSADSRASEVRAIHNSHSDSVSPVSNLTVTFNSLGDESVREAVPAGLGFLVSSRDQDLADGSVLHVDVASISSNIFSRGIADTNNHESRSDSRRLFGDAFSRRSSRRLTDSPTIVFSPDDTEDLGSHDRWLLDFTGDFFDYGVGVDSGYLGSRIHSMNEDSGTHAISRIFMLAEALFEVLDEIHRQPVPLSLSMVSLPAPESVVESFPLKNHRKADKGEGVDDIDQCYICLADYEEGDKIRVLPCHHEYHMSCVDKWLKEIHGVCPLCRGDFRQGGTESSHSEIP